MCFCSYTTLKWIKAVKSEHAIYIKLYLVLENKNEKNSNLEFNHST